MNLFKPYRGNPAPDEVIDTHGKLWTAVSKLRIGQARLEERVRYSWLLNVGIMATQVAILSLIVVVVIAVVI